MASENAKCGQIQVYEGNTLKRSQNSWGKNWKEIEFKDGVSKNCHTREVNEKVNRLF